MNNSPQLIYQLWRTETPLLRRHLLKNLNDTQGTNSWIADQLNPKNVRWHKYRQFQCNRPFPNSKKSPFQKEAKCITFLVKMTFFCLRIKFIFISMVLHFASLWNRGSGQLGNSLWRQRRFTWVWRLGFQSSCSVLTCRWRELVVTNKWIHWSKGGTTWHFTCVILITNGCPTIHTFSVWWENWKAEITPDFNFFFCVEESVKAT